MFNTPNHATALPKNFTYFCVCALSLRETLGISADGSEKLFRDDDTEAFEKRVDEPLIWIDRDHRLNVAQFFVAVDPSGGGASAFSICSALTTPTGRVQILGVEALNTREVRTFIPQLLPRILLA